MKNVFLRTCTILSTLIATGSSAQTVSTPYTLSGSGSKGIAVGPGDTLFVAGYSDYQIYKIPPGGSPILFIGSGSSGSTDGVGTAASLGDVYDMEVDASGNLYFADYLYQNIRKATPDGTVSTIASFPDGIVSLALGKNDTLYSYSYISGNFSRVDPGGTVTSIAMLPSGAIDLDYVSHDTFYLAGYLNNVIYQIAADGTYTVLAGSGTSGLTDGTGTSAEFANPFSLVRDGLGDLYIADFANHTVRKVSSAGIVSTFAGDGTPGTLDGTGTLAKFTSPIGITISPTSGTLYVSQLSDVGIRAITGATALPLSWLKVQASLTAQRKTNICWEVQEEAVSRYEVLKSTDGRTFTVIGTLKALGDGTRQYSFTDPQQVHKKSYYRVRQIHTDGGSDQTQTLVVSASDLSATTLSIYPSVVDKQLHIDSKIPQTLCILDMQGKLVLHIYLHGDGRQSLDVGSWHSGTYFVQAENGSVYTIVKP